MRLTVEADDFMPAVKRLMSVVPSRNTIPILKCLLLRAEGETLMISATNLEMEMTVTIPAQVEEPGACAIAAAMLMLAEHQAKSGAPIRIEVDDLSGTMRAGRFRSKLQGFPESDWPHFARVDTAYRASVDAKAFRLLMETALPAVGTDSVTRGYLCGVFLHQSRANDEPVLRAVATDGNRLHCADMAMPTGLVGMPGVIVPSEVIKPLLPPLERAEQVELSVGEDRIEFGADNTRLVSKLVGGTFPDYTRIVPVKHDHSVMVDMAELAGAIRTAGQLVAKEIDRTIYLHFEEDRIRVFGRSKMTNEEAEIEVDGGYEGEPMRVCINSQYLVTALDSLPGETAEMLMGGPFSAFRVTVPMYPEVLAVLMPLRG